MKKSTKILLLIVAITFLLIILFTSNDTPIKVYVNNTELQFDVPPTNIEGRTLVPVRALLEKLGAKVEWNQVTKTVTAQRGQTLIIFDIDNKSAIVNGKTVDLDVPLKIINGRTLAPLRFISENLGSKVAWNAESKTINITDNFLNNIPNDKVSNGIYTWNNGTTYDGEWDNKKISGKGTLKYVNGDKYSGDFKNNKRHGYGIYTWDNGECYMGNWTEDKMNGQGIYKYKNGDEYDGNWKAGKMNGQGTYKYKNGKTLTGIWKENKYSSAK